MNFFKTSLLLAAMTAIFMGAGYLIGGQGGMLIALVVAAGAANDARVEETPEGWRVVGQPTEGALDVLAAKAGADIEAITRLAQVPFESAHKFSATLDDVPGGGRVVHALGAPDRLLDRCATQVGPGGEPVALDREAWEHHIDVLMGLVDQVAVMYSGSIIAFDVPQRIMENPLVQSAYLGRTEGNAA